MRVLVSTTAGSGHFGPTLPFARACRAAGHKVAVAAPASFVAEVEAADFPHLAFADVPPEVMGAVFARLPSLSFEEANEVVVGEVFAGLDAQAAWPGLVEIVDEWRPDLVLREPCEFGSLVAAHAAGVPQVAVAIGMRAMDDFIGPVVAAPLAELDEAAGLPAGTSVQVMGSSPTLTCVPAAVDDAGRPGSRASDARHRFRDDSLAPSQATPPGAWGDPAHPLVYVSFGSVTAGLGGFKDLYPAVLDAFADQPVRLLLTTGHAVDPGHLGAVPDNARVEQWWPQAEVMPHTAAMVGHGGFGTTMAAMAAGVPQVVMPLFAHDQRINAEHVEAVGAGLHLEAGPEAVSALPSAVDRIVSDEAYRTAARTVADEIGSMPPVADAVPLLEQLAAS